ncbi:hypothetical protein IRZ83_19390 [Flavobacterium sp. JLP]|uniref:hypothetical protein n=1 Tax=unclassified Flavobacterium TaxID=196869 RepID=UPI00188BD707|nr:MULTISPECIES: hypothetical protein [unclassified Flavobacterium]MBF4494825.1 hypothetical protein [Flavobacterium sp. MR2016-29]MBF4508839.1 hypothetical protein [Flavobacterium sp. JLP]
MKKIIFTLITCFGAAIFSYGQIGVNTPKPLSTFDIAAKKSTGTAVEPEGLLMPRVDRQRAQSMVGVKTATMIYIMNVSTGTQTGTARFIDQNGFYSYDEVVAAWIKTTPPAPIVPQPIASTFVLMNESEDPPQVWGYGWNEPVNSQNSSLYKDFTIPVGTLTKDSGSIEFSFRIYRSQGAGVWGNSILMSEDNGATWPDNFSWGGAGGDVVMSGRIFFNDGKLTLWTSNGISFRTTVINNAAKAVTFRLTATTTDLITRMTIDYARFILVK